jgi:hypothetical protein
MATIAVLIIGAAVVLYVLVLRRILPPYESFWRGGGW